MRTYPTDSPEAAARIVALALMADGHVCKTEIDVLERVGAYAQLGLDRPALQAVLQGFCEDLLQSQPSHGVDAGRLEDRTLAQLLAEVEDPALRRTVLRLCVAVAEADAHIADGESLVLVTAVEQWGLQHDMLATPQPADCR